MQVYASILVTIDCSPVDQTILDHVALLALQNSARVYLLHVVHSHSLDQETVLRKRARETLKSHAEHLRAQGIDAEVLMRRGEPDEEILAEIESGEYDLVAMATHGHRFLGDILFGSVSQSLKHQISIPLLLLRADR